MQDKLKTAGGTVEEAHAKIFEPEAPTPATTGHKCEAPQVNCRFPGKLYQVEFMGEEGIVKKKVHLCPGHAKKARESDASLTKL
jgi:hypothetical protein